MMGADYERPAMPSPTEFRFVDEPQAETLTNLPWWEVFDDQILQDLIREAIANNLDLRAAIARVEEARARAGIARSYLYPQIDGVAGYGVRQASNSDDDESTSQGANYGFQLSWELDLFGRLRRQEEAAVALVLATDQARRGVLVTLISDLASNYFLLRELDVQLEIALRTLALNDETVAYFRNRLEGGVANRLELDRITANRARTAAAIPEIERQRALVENLISFIAGRLPGPIFRTRPALEPLPLPPPVPPGLPAALLEKRPDIAEAEQILVAANANIGAAKALFFPTISLTGFLGGVSGDLTQFIGSEGAVWSLAGNLFQPIFQGGRLQRNVEAEQARFDAALANYMRAALNGYREVADALVTIQKLAQIRTELEVGVLALQDASELARVRYDSGLASYIEILTADQELFEQQLLLAQTMGAEMRGRANLYRALGGGWDF